MLVEINYVYNYLLTDSQARSVFIYLDSRRSRTFGDDGADSWFATLPNDEEVQVGAALSTPPPPTPQQPYIAWKTNSFSVHSSVRDIVYIGSTYSLPYITYIGQMLFLQINYQKFEWILNERTAHRHG